MATGEWYGYEKKGPVTVLADNVDGKRFNSPNDVVLKSDGTVYFTDPPYGLPGFFNDPRKELDYSGVFMIKNGKVHVVSKDLGGPNGLAFSPDEKYLYVTNWDIRDIHHTKTLWRYEVQPDGTLKNGKIFFDFNFTEDDEALDGMKVDKEGNFLYLHRVVYGYYVQKENYWVRLLHRNARPIWPGVMRWKNIIHDCTYQFYKIRVNTGGKFSWQ